MASISKIRIVGLTYKAKISDRGDYYEWDSVLTDITELKQQQEELTQARQSAIEATEAKSRFLANMSHDPNASWWPEFARAFLGAI
ncbi:hypothetical protein OH492_08260 [Vibrio chagasii]|nr:hypothetical protein [Vibrio chagasii]